MRPVAFALGQKLELTLYDIDIDTKGDQCGSRALIAR